MSGTVKQVAIHQIRLGKPKKNGDVDVVAPGKEFDCPEDELDFLQSAGACRDPEPTGEKSPDPAPVDPDARRQALIAQAKAMKIKGIRKDMSEEAVQAKIDEHNAAQDGGDGGDDGDDEDDDEDDEDEDVL